MKLVRIRTATPLEERRLRLEPDDGRVIERDVTPLIRGPVFEAVRASDEVFRAVTVEGGTVVWPNGEDLCPDVLIWGGPPPVHHTPNSSTRNVTQGPAAGQNLDDRLTRARSWLSASEGFEPTQLQEIFIALYIAFNALYGRRQYEGDRSQTAKDLETFSDRLAVLHDADLEGGRATLTNALLVARPTIRAVATNVFLRDVYWRRDMPHAFLVKKLQSQYALAERRLIIEGQWKPLLRLALERVVVLRNQVFHGCVTHGPDSRGWQSVEQGIAVLRILVPAFVELLERHGNLVKWDPLPYPRLGSTLHPEKGRLA